jgi:hypothetical protein
MEVNKMPCLLKYKRNECDNCPLGVECAKINWALELSIEENNYKEQAKLEALIEKYQKLTASMKYIT